MTVIDREKLDALVAEGWLRSQRHPDADLWIFNYTEKTQYENFWTPETTVCRGLILDAEGHVVARPFPKFFNYGTPQAPVLPNEPFTVREKIDGSLGILYYLDGEARIATRGSFTSEQAIAGTRLLQEYEFEHADAQTPLFEIVYPENRIVVDYGDRRELVLLAVIDNATGAESAMAWSGRTAELLDHDDPATLATLEKPNSEGFVVTFQSGVRVKVKFAEYVRLHKIVTGVNARMVWESLRVGDDLDALIKDVPDEIFRWMTDKRTELLASFGAAEALALDVFNRRPDADRKTLAEFFLKSGANPSVLFRMLDGKPYDDLIWKAIRPGVEVPGVVVKEEEEILPSCEVSGA
jgi:RNA ligase